MVQACRPDHGVTADHSVCSGECDKRILAMEYSGALVCLVHCCNESDISH